MTQKEIDHQYYLAQKDTHKYKERNARGTRKWKQGHRKQVNQASRVWERGYKESLKLDVLSHYGPSGNLQCNWPECTVIDVDMLSLDHVNNDGAQDRKNIQRGGSGCPLYSRVRKAGFPDGFQTLCHNHQWKKELMRRREGRK